VKLDVTGGSFGSGEVAIDATGQMFYDGVIDASSGSSGLAGTVDLNSDAEMFLTGDVTVSGAHVNTVVGRIDVRGCRVEFLNGASFNNAASNGINRLVARERISVAVGAAVLAPTSGGQNRITYRTPAKPPQISGVVSPSPTLVVDKNLPGCPVCGNNELDGGETCEDGNINPGDGCSADCQDEGCIADTPGYPSVVLCDDQDACTVDSCNTTQHACEHVSSCDDGIACTVDSCAGNECVHTPNDALCDAGSPCADDFCNETNGCLFAPRSGPCDDALFCNGADTCANGSCSEHTGDPCVGGAECRDTCDESSDTCIAPGGSPCSEDGNECTSDFCNGSGLCIHPANNAACSDGVFCNGLDFCQSGACTVHSGNPCTEQGECRDVCDEAAGACQAVAGNECSDDGNICTEDVCDGSGGCSHIESATFDQGRAIVTRRSGPGNDRLLIAGAFPLADLTAEPSDTGVLVDIRDENGDAVYDAILPSSAIQNVKGASKVFKFKDRTGEHPDTNGIAVAIFKRDTKRAIVKFKIRGRGYEIPQIVGKPHVSMAMLFGEDPGIGDCISGASLPCGARGSKVLCGD
jgi:cysteine-rich repeat protein